VTAVVATAVVLLGVEAVQFAAAPHAAKAAAEVTTGTGGRFVPAAGRVLDTRNGTGGYTDPMPAGVWRPVQVTGLAGVPSTGVGAVQVTVTAVTPTTGGWVSLFPDLVSPASAGTSLLFNLGSTGTISNTSIVAVGSNGRIQARSSSTVILLIDVQGYYTAGDPTAGGYVPITPKRIVNTTNGTGLPLAKLAAGSTTTIQVSGLAGVPADASAVFVNLTPINYSTTIDGYLTPYPTGTTRPINSLNFARNIATAIGATVDLNNDTGQFSLYEANPTGAFDISIDVLGYFSASTGTGAFIPAATRVFDSRSPHVQLAAGTTTTVQSAGVAGVPVAGSGISAIALNLQVIATATAHGYLRAWTTGQAEPTTISSLNFDDSDARSNLTIIPPSGDGRISLHNVSTGPVDYVFSVQGWYTSVGAAIPTGQSRTQQRITLQGAATGGGNWVTYKYRVGTTNPTWSLVPIANVTVPGTTTHPPAWPATRYGSPAVFDPYTWDMLASLGSPNDALIQVEACFGSAQNDANPVCSMPSDVQFAAHAFGDSFATSAVGPGQLSLLTGDYALSATDATVPTYHGSLSIGRTFTTLAPTVETATAAGVFGPGWTSSLTGPSSGDADLTLTDKSGSGYLLFKAGDGGLSTYQATSQVSNYPISFAGVDTAAGDGKTVIKADAAHITVTDSDGTTTTWTYVSPAWQVSSVVQVGASATTTSNFFYNTSGTYNGLPSQITAPTPDATNIVCSTAALALSDTGCRSLTLTYATVAGRTRLNSVSFVPGGLTAIPIASYDYTGAGLLADVYDPRITPNLKTAYTYDTNGRLATLTPPGLAAWTLAYDTQGRLSTVAQPDAVLAQTAVNTIAYGSGLTGSPIDLSKTAAAAWGQTDDLPATFSAVFAPNRQPSSTDPATITAADWLYASINYLDVNGRTTNTASYGAAAWQYDATAYDSSGNTVWTLTPGNRSQAITPTTDTDTAVAGTTPSAARAALLTSTSTFDPLHPDRVTDNYGPTHPVILSDGSTVHARSHAHTVFDEGAPTDTNGNPITFGLPTTVTSGAWNITTGDDVADAVTTKTGYGAVAIGGTKTGWDLYAATSTTTVGAGTGGGDLTTNTRYNDNGQVVQSWLPGSTGSDARAKYATYYTATGTGNCVSPALAGLSCTAGPASQPSSGNPLPVSTTSYNLYNQPLVVTETIGSTVRTTTSTYDAAGRGLTSSIGVSPVAAGGAALPTVTTSYNTTTGLRTTVSAGGQTLTAGYDSLGRVASYTNATGNTSTTGYDISGNIVSINDGKGTASFSYDSTTEHRGLVTGEDVGVSPAPASFSAAYNPDGSLWTETYPNGLTATHTYDNAGDTTKLVYAKDSTNWMTFIQAVDALGRIGTRTSPQSSQTFSYDTAGRLIQSKDNTAGTCTTRQYALDNGSNRTSLKSYPALNGTVCSTGTTPTTVTSTFDDADRIINTGYAYDTLGRNTSMPSADAKGIGTHASTSGNLTLGYYANDMAASQTQGGTSLTFGLDPLQNRSLTSSDGSITSTNHYADSGDSAAWTSTSAGTWTRNVIGIDGGLAVTVDQTGTATLQLANPHGDIVATAADTTAASGISTYSESSEFGVPRTSTSAFTTFGYTGAAQRSSNALGGVIQMGVRLYNTNTGLFTSVDSIYGGNNNSYTYPSDPVNSGDLSGDACRTITKKKDDTGLFGERLQTFELSTTWCYNGIWITSWNSHYHWSYTHWGSPHQADGFLDTSYFRAPGHGYYSGFKVVAYAAFGNNAHSKGGSSGHNICISEQMFYNGASNSRIWEQSYSSLSTNSNSNICGY
jgi:RHS repeat-associated protein